MELEPRASGENPSEREKCLRNYMREIQNGSTDALGRLYDVSAPTLYSLAFRVVRNSADAEEVLLDVFEQVWRRADTFDPIRGGVLTWLLVLARSRALDRLRSTATIRLREQAACDDFDIGSRGPHPEQASAMSEQGRRVRLALSTLPPEQRQALELAYFSELTHTEIAARLRVPLGTIKTRIRIAMDKLRTALCSIASGSSSK